MATAPSNVVPLSLSSNLRDGASADIWYDARAFGTDAADDPDRAAERLIENTQAAMANAADFLENAYRLVEALVGELRYVHETGDVCDSRKNVAGDGLLERADALLVSLREGRALANADAQSLT